MCHQPKDTKMKVSAERLENDASRWNDWLFDGAINLEDITFICKTSKGFSRLFGDNWEDIYGFVSDTSKGFILCINLDRCYSATIYHATLIHELVHLYCIQKQDYWGHGKGFAKMRKRIYKQTGIKI